MRERIVATATGMFVHRGYEGVAMREIADACGITKAALYYHFDGKSDLLNAIFTSYLAELAAVVEASADHGAGEPRLRWLVEQLFALPAEHRAIMRLAMHEVGHLQPEHRAAFGAEYRERFIGPLQQVIADGAAHGEFAARDPAVVVWILLGMLYPFFAPPGAGPTAGQDTVSDLLEIFFHGLSHSARADTTDAHPA